MLWNVNACLSVMSWGEGISLWVSVISAALSITTIYILVKEYYAKKRPYLQFTFELVRSSLACIVLRNVGETPLSVKSIKFSEDFLKQLDEATQTRIRKMQETNINIFPNRFFVISLDVGVNVIIESYITKTLGIEFSYSKLKKARKSYHESIKIDFDDYGGFLVYLSEVDEFRQSNEKYQKEILEAIKNNTNEIKSLKNTNIGLPE